ncbi:MAG: DNA topoisomerase 3 [Duncaniella sp.]|nr:DNA topoisomerase 3 [Duncaniella sp.]HBI58632.1 DNA topoisomerase III [Porphyromonadaceae bacterium]
MKLCITEKPSVAKDIAEILGAKVRRDGYYEGGDYKITWTFGHLCCLKEPHDYTEMWKRWTLGVLPMIPAKFGIKVIDQESIKRQFHVIETLIAEADEVINCGDAGQEGELIQRWVMQKAGIKCPVMRLWISSLTDESIREGFNSLRPEKDFNNLYYAGLSRAIGDWILGMNGTRLYSLKYSSPGNVLSIGRVQTPTLALIVQRHFEIANFKPEDFWELKTVYRGATFNATSGRFKSEADAASVLARIATLPMTITDVQEKKGREAPPRLFDLTSLQVECNKKWGWTADDSLRLIQSLYEKKVTTYPRVDTTYLSDDIYPKIPTILKQMTPYAALTAPVLGEKIPKSKKVFDNSKVTDHHAIIPTGQSPSQLVGDERKLYHLIALRFIAAFYPDCQFMSTTVNGEVDKTGFKATGKVITDPGWRKVYEGKKDENPVEEGKDDDKLLPPFVVGESGPHEPALQKKTTQPPKYYTEGTLLRAMESAGKTVDDEELRDAMKENGIGRPSTRAAIIETLFKRRYIYRSGKSIMASQAGIDLIGTINEELLKSAKLTGLWENKLRRIERGEYSAAEFIDELKALINEIVLNVLRDNSGSKILVQNGGDRPSPSATGKEAEKPAKEKAPRKPRVTKLEQIACPECGQGHILKGRTAYGCSRFREGCTLRLSFEEYSAELTPGKLNQAINKLKSRNGSK